MADSAIKRIEQAIVAKLKAALPGVDVESYAGQLDDPHAEFLRRLPCVWVTFERAPNPNAVARRKTRKTARFQVMAAQRALGPEPSARHGDFGQVGVYDLLEEGVESALLHETLGLPIQPLQATGMQMVVQGYFANDAIAVMSAGYETSYDDRKDEPELQPPGVLERVGLDYSLKPGDDVPDASDLVTTQP